MIGGKTNYVCLLSLIRKESTPLYDAICDLCMDGTFRSQRYENTFLYPSDKLIKEIVKKVADDKDEEAIDMLRSLILKKHLTLDDFKKDASIGTLQAGSKVLKNPADVAKSIKKAYPKTVNNKDNKPVILIYQYDGDRFPETVEGKSGGMVPVGYSRYGGGNDGELKNIRNITKDLIVENNADKTISNFFKGVSALLAILEKEEDTNSFEKAKFYLAANPILSWFFLIMPGSSNGLIKNHHLKDFTLGVTDHDLIKKCIEGSDNEGSYSFDRDLFKKINRVRTQLIGEKGDKSSLMSNIKKSYHDMLPTFIKHKSINGELAEDKELKILMDELRFFYEDSVSTWGDVDDAITALGAINWNQPGKHHVLTDDDIYKKYMLKGTESFISGPVTFVKSVYFLYVPLTESIEEQLLMSKKSGGNISGGNPNLNNQIVFSGGAAKSKMKKNGNSKLDALIRGLSKSQRAELKDKL